MIKNFLNYKIWKANLSEKEKKEFFDLGKKLHSESVIQIIFNDIYFGSILKHISTRFTDEIETCRLTFENYTQAFYFEYNPLFLYYFGNDEKTYTTFFIIHELYHFILDHLSNRIKDKKLHLWNVATDLAINSMIKEDFKRKRWKLPKLGVFPGLGKYKNFEKMKSSEHYYSLLDNSYNIEDFTEDESFDEHLLPSGEDKTNAHFHFQKIIKNSYKEIDGCNYSNNIINKNVISLLKENQDKLSKNIDPYSILSKFIYKTISSGKSFSYRKYNKKFPGIFPGTKKKKQTKIAISVDQSSSISDFLLMEFFNICKKFLTLTEFDIIPFDSDVIQDGIKEFKIHDNEILTLRTANGSTDYNSSIEFVNKNYQYNGHIILTDLEAFKPEIKSRCPLIWIAPKNCDPYFDLSDEIVVYF